MKYPILLFFSLAIYSSSFFAQTYTNTPSPENVLVVYNSRIDSSIIIKNYYSSVRNIPYYNLCPLYLPDTNIVWGPDTHFVKIGRVADVIIDTVLSNWATSWPLPHAWKYFLDFIATPIQNWITNYQLNTQIRYIVLCKGIPNKIQSRGDWSGSGEYGANGNLSIDGLLCLLNSYNYNNLILNYIYKDGRVLNPYFLQDVNNTLNYHFLPDYFTYGSYSLSYLISHLDALSYSLVIKMIDRSLFADKSGNGLWILDDDPLPNISDIHTQFSSSSVKLNNLGFNVIYNNTNDWITSKNINTSNNPVIGYCSSGRHAEDDKNEFDSIYVVDSLSFKYLNGSIFSTFESFNGTSLTDLKFRAKQGLMTQFINVGGTSGLCTAWEPQEEACFNIEKCFISYALGYNLVDAAYLGMRYLAWQNIVVEDPLTTIAWGKQTVTDNLSWNGKNCVTGIITIPKDKSITLSDSSSIKFLNGGFITGEGYVIPQGIISISVQSWDKGLLKAKNGSHPKLIWGAYPSTSFGAKKYRVYRKYGSSFENVYTTPNDSIFTWTDANLNINTLLSSGTQVDYYVVAINAADSLSSASNIVNYCVVGANPEKRQNLSTNIDKFALFQNFPNPFNPSTRISFTLSKPGFTQLKLYDVFGREVKILINEFLSEGFHNYNFNGNELASGVYLYTLNSEGSTETKKMILVK